MIEPLIESLKTKEMTTSESVNLTKNLDRYFSVLILMFFIISFQNT